MTSTIAPSIPTTLADVDRLVLQHHKRHKAFPGHSDSQIRAKLCESYRDGFLHVFPQGIVIAEPMNGTIYVNHILQWAPGLINHAMKTVRKHAPTWRIVGARGAKLVDFTKAYG